MLSDFGLMYFFPFSYGDTLNRNILTLAQNNTFNTLGRTSTFNQRHNPNGDLTTNTLGRNNRYTDVPIANPLFHR